MMTAICCARTNDPPKVFVILYVIMMVTSFISECESCDPFGNSMRQSPMVPAH